MKKITLLTLFAFVSMFTFSQTLKDLQKAKLCKITKVENANISHQTKSTLAALDTIWYEDFSDSLSVATNYTFVDNTGNGYNWVCTTDGPTGAYTQPSEIIHSTSAANGYMLLNGDAYNTVGGSIVGSPVNMDAYFQTPAIDCSSKSTVVLKFEQKFRYCCSSTTTHEVMISNDGTNWYSYDVEEGIFANISSSDPDIVKINISQIAANQSTVYIRFYHQGASHYFYCIDDVLLYEASDHDLVLQKPFVDFLYSGTPVYYQFPLPQVYGANGIFFESKVHNLGGNPEVSNYNVKVTKTDNDSVVFNETSASNPSIAVGATDTIQWDITGSDMAFYPTETGTYRVRQEFSVTGDYSPNDNIDSSITFNITDTTLAIYKLHDDDICVGNYRTPAGDSQDGDCIANMFLLSTADTISSINVYIKGGSGGTDIGTELYGYVWDYENGESIVLETLLPHVITSSDINHFVTIDFDRSDLGALVLQPDHIYLYGFSSSNGNALVYGDRSTFQAPGSTWIYINGDQWWWITTIANMNLNLYRTKNTNSINSQNTIDFSVSQNYPNPAKDNTTITYRLTKANNVSLDIYDNIGKKVMSINENKKLAGKHSININTSNLESGIYTYTLTVGDKSQTKKMSVIK